MDVEKITKVSTTCTNCDTVISVTEPNFRTVCTKEFKCPVCEESLGNIKHAISKIFEFNNSVNDVNEILNECDDVTI